MQRTYLIPGWPWFVRDDRLYFGMQEMRNADKSTFRPLNEWWGRDADHLYCAGSRVREADAETFRVLNSLYAKDSRNAYTIMGSIRGADASSFEAIGPTDHLFNTTNGYAKDLHLVYHTIVGGKACVVKGADAASFTALGKGYGADKSAVYFERKKVLGADPEKWKHVRGPHSRSGKNAYVLGQKIRGADGTCLESLPVLESGEFWCRDDKSYYRREQPADPADYLKLLRQCFIFVGEVASVSLTWNQNQSLDPTRRESWNIATHAWIFVDCKEWIQKPDLDLAEFPAPGESFKLGVGLELRFLSSREWMNEDRIWILKPSQHHQYVERRLVLSCTPHWCEYSTLDQLEGIKKSIAATAHA